MSLFVDIEKKLGQFRLRVRLEAGEETLALLGASGCGKSMTLKCIAGIEKPDRGRIVVNGRTLFDSEKKINLSPQQRRVGLMFQNYALFPNMTVRQNIMAGAVREKGKTEREQSVDRILETFDIAALAARLPAQLSGGQQQRVALARLLVSDPEILLLDEPFSALDSHLRFRMEQEMRRTIERFGSTVVLVSHDRDEVYRFSGKIAVMANGRVETLGEKRRVFRDPETRQSAVLTGCKNISRAAIGPDGRINAIDWGFSLANPDPGRDFDSVGVRMHDIHFGPGENSVDCLVAEEIENQFSMTVMLRPVDAPRATPIGWELNKERWRAIRAERITVHIPPESLLLLQE